MNNIAPAAFGVGQADKIQHALTLGGDVAGAAAVRKAVCQAARCSVGLTMPPDSKSWRF
ncbi:hypothetical protein N7E01_07195 [Neopusillimonas aromaticivorans]|nr:hypothetical protein [Neopusillimonas aromaticivorans]WJJ94684.1 hypothetical protein N7E01_07195 [Neopusillimonas aromaticivorans]